MDRFESSLEHLQAEAKRIDLLIRRQIVEMRLQRGKATWDECRGLYISEEDMDCLLSSAFFTAAILDSELARRPELYELNQELQQLEADICERKDNSIRSGIELRLERLKQTFGLSPFELDSILIGLLPELDIRYLKLYAYIQDDVTKKGPSIDLILRLLNHPDDSGSARRTSFLPQAALLRHRLVSLHDFHAANSASLLEKALKVEQRIVDCLLGSDQPDSRLSSFVRLIKPSVDLSEIMLPSEAEERLRNVLEVDAQRQCPLIFLCGPYGAGKRMTAEAICHELGLSLLVIDMAQMLMADLPFDLAIELVTREAILQKGCLYWDRYDLLLIDDRNGEAFRQKLLEELEQHQNVAILGSQTAWEPTTGQTNKPFLKIELPVPPFGIRKQLWERNIDGSTAFAADVDVDALANKFRFTGGQIRDAIATAKNLSIGRDNGDGPVTMNDLYYACRAQSNQKLSALARKIQPRFTWDDIVLPKDQMAQLREITNYVKYRHVVYTQWNFDRKLSLGRGLNVLFAGPSGTGKTMAAEIIAGELKLDVYKIDLSTIVSKYIGETEKNLDRIFKEAQDSNAILFFDEADAVFGKRSEVRDSHDRYANIEIAYLLQKMEEYEGIVILATNLRKNLDEAFARRMHFSVEFPMPEEPDRYQIWQRVFPAEAPLSKDVDLYFMARQFKVTGGNIKNIAVAAAFLAAADGRKINVEHLIRATKREYQKIGRLCTEADFANYFDMVKG